MQNDSRAGGAYRMAEGDRAAVDIQFILIQRTQRTVQSELVAAVLLVLPRREAAEHLRGEGLVDFPIVEVIQAQAMALQDRRRRVHRPEAHLRRIEAGPFRVHDSPDGGQIEF